MRSLRTAAFQMMTGCLILILWPCLAHAGPAEYRAAQDAPSLASLAAMEVSDLRVAVELYSEDKAALLRRARSRGRFSTSPNIQRIFWTGWASSPCLPWPRKCGAWL